MVVAHNINEKDRTNDIQISGDVTFESMLLSPLTLEGLRNSGFYRPSPVQLLGIPMGKCGFDLLLEAKSGTGKTAVFTVIALEKIQLTKGLQVIILAPTREIAAQICSVIKEIGSCYEGLQIEVVMGGLPVKDDISKFSKRDVHIVVGSPGRLKHLISEKHIDISAVRLLVLDEADKLVESSFINDIKHIYARLPKQKQVILSSATFPDSSKLFIDQFVYSAQHICPNSNYILLGISQKTTIVEYNSNIVRQTLYRYKELVNILTKISFKQCLIFCNYQARVGELHKLLTKNKWPAEKLHGLQDQIDRLDALKTLQEYKCRILVSTDLASRGIDASNIDLVINFEPPFEWPTYLHRIGRAGRFGSYGTAITILSEGSETKKFMKLIDPLNVAINLSPLWNNNNDDQDKNKKEETVTKAEPIIKKEIVTKAEPIIKKEIVTKSESITKEETVTKVEPIVKENAVTKEELITEENSITKANTVIKETVESSSVKSLDPIDLLEITKKACTENTQDFEQLCKSFETTLNDTKLANIQSFSDLVDSFKNFDENVIQNGYQYQCLRIPEKTKLENKETQVKNNILDHIFKNENTVTSCETEIIEKEKNNKFPNVPSKPNIDISEKNKIKHNVTIGFETTKTIQNNYSNLSAIELGLPTAFISSKEKRYYENCKKRIEHNKKIHDAPEIWKPRPFLSKNYNSETNSFHVKAIDCQRHKKSSNFDRDLNICHREQNSTTIPKIVNKSSINKEKAVNAKNINRFTIEENIEDTFKGRRNRRKEYNKSSNKEQGFEVKQINNVIIEESNEISFMSRHNSNNIREYNKSSNKEQTLNSKKINNSKIKVNTEDTVKDRHNSLRDYNKNSNKEQIPNTKNIDCVKIDANNKNTFNSRLHSLRECDISYYNWYNQLKSRVKQIEMLVYVDELSKLHI